MPTFIQEAQANSSKFNSKIENHIQPKVLSKYDTKLHVKEEESILDDSFKSDFSESSVNDELGLDTPYVDKDENNNSKLQPKKYNGFQMVVLPTKDKIIVRNNFLYLDPKTFSIVWHNVLLFIILHSLGFIGVYKCYSEHKFYAFASSYLIGIWGGLGITAGAHRLWSHRSYSARLPLRIFLMIGHTIAGQNNLYVWCRDHRVHHKFTETDADPHNSKRGFFFAHMGWLLRKKHPDVFTKGAKVPLQDLLDDPVIRFNIRYYYLMYFMFAFFLPTWVGAYLYNEGWLFSFLVASAARYMTSLHSTWFVNSAAHMFGDQPYSTMEARENPFVSAAAFGEGYHNFHHTFSWDYSTSELGTSLNTTKKFIDLMALIGLAYNLKRASKDLIEKSMANQVLLNERKRLAAY